MVKAFWKELPVSLVCTGQWESCNFKVSTTGTSSGLRTLHFKGSQQQDKLHVFCLNFFEKEKKEPGWEMAAYS